ncbi:putative hydrolase of the HAD superfamily [Kribbella aluminosa]|uniref:Hydrolase of the HAD superfamily n=1 Tax=Kribbella aluminosa TaxID=416017 RepID=A0ABS4UM88_9ACTN|nr:HAD family hydrolase [Kribbella aluminosa]MBP2352767.1 putative hydrolase of the HAD superfamily [Kribbella aluminosa]
MKVLLTDLFSTLIPGGDASRDAVNAQMGAVLGVDPAAFQRAFDASSYDRFIGSYGDLPATLRVIAERCGGAPTTAQVQEATSLRRALARNLLSAAPPATLDTLGAFKAAGWRIGLVSNITAETQLQWPNSPMAQYCDATMFSAEVGAAKPDPAIYRAACTALGADPTDCIYVGDGNDGELPAAAALGMYTIRTLEHADNDPTWQGPTIKTFAELTTHLP